MDIRPFVYDEVQVYMDAMVRKHSNKYDGAQWRKVPIGSCDRPIPEFALHTAVRIKEADAAAKLEIVYLTKVPADPFLKVTIGTRSAYVEFWDEAAFQGKRQI